MHFTVRLGKRNTSVRIRNDLLALWYVLCFPDEEVSYNKVQREVRKFLGKCLTGYRPASSHIGNQGVTDFVNQRIVAEVLDRPEQKRYLKALKMLEGSVFGSGGEIQVENLAGVDAAPLILPFTENPNSTLMAV